MYVDIDVEPSTPFNTHLTPLHLDPFSVSEKRLRLYSTMLDSYSMIPKLESSESIAAVVGKRVTRGIARMMDSFADVNLLSVAASPSDFDAVFELLRQAPIEQKLSAKQRTLLRGAQYKQELIEKNGGCFKSTEVATLLGVTRTTVGSYLKKRILLGIPSGSSTAYPACQFEDGKVVPGMADVLAVLENNEVTGMGAFLFLVGNNDSIKANSTGHETPLEALIAGDKDLVMGAANAYMTQDRL